MSILTSVALTKQTYKMQTKSRQHYNDANAILCVVMRALEYL